MISLKQMFEGIVDNTNELKHLEVIKMNEEFKKEFGMEVLALTVDDIEERGSVYYTGSMAMCFDNEHAYIGWSTNTTKEKLMQDCKAKVLLSDMVEVIKFYASANQSNIVDKLKQVGDKDCVQICLQDPSFKQVCVNSFRKHSGDYAFCYWVYPGIIGQ